MEKPTFWRLLFETLGSVQSVFLGIVGIAATGYCFFFKPDWKISGNYFVLTLVLSAAAVLVLAAMLFKIWPILALGIPKVRFSGEIALRSGPHIFLLLDKSRLFAVDATVGIYRQRQEYEQFVGVGHVLTIQANGLIQVAIEDFAAPVDAVFIEQLRACSREAIAQTLVKPTIPRYYGDA